MWSLDLPRFRATPDSAGRGPRPPGSARAAVAAFRRSLAALTLAALGLGGVAAQAATAPAGFAIDNRAQASYVPDGLRTPETLYSNVVTARVAAVVSLQLTTDQTVNRAAGSPVLLSHVLTNTGNVASSYRFALDALAGADYALLAPRLVLDRDGNGVADAGDPLLVLGTASALSLEPGAAATLLVVASVPMAARPAGAAVRAARMRLLATAAAAGTGETPAAAVVDTVRVGPLAALVVSKRADPAGRVTPGTRVTYDISVSNVGDASAGAVDAAAASAGSTPVRVDGRAERVLLLRDLIPTGLRYAPGSLATSLPGAWRLFRLPGDAPFSYRSNGDDAAAIEVAVAVPAGSLAPNVTASMRLAAIVGEAVDGDAAALTNRADVFFDDGSGPALATSNPVRLELPTQRVGLALRAGAPQLERDPASGRPLGTALVRLTFVLQNFGPEVARELQVQALLAGGMGSFGRYTRAAQPQAGEYTVLPALASITPLRPGSVLALDSAFDGDLHVGLLAPGSMLVPDGRAELTTVVRVTVAGHAGRLLQRARLSASLGQPVHTQLADDSADGSEPDANGDRDPGNDASPTPVLLSLPTLSLSKTASLPRSVAGGQRRYEVDYTLAVTNNGDSLAPFVQLTDHLDCAFRIGSPDVPLLAWHLVGPPVAAQGRLTVNPEFTGRGACAQAPSVSDDAFLAMPREPAVQLTDGQHHLAPGQTEQIRYTVQFDIDPAVPVSKRVLRNVAHAAAYDGGPAGASPPALLAAVASSAVTPVPADPSGVVYNAMTRQPVAGAVVHLRRERCDAGAPTPITADELTARPDLAYRFLADGSVAVTTGADGVYAFLLNMPPISDTCEYRLGVTPPPQSGLTWPSKTLPPAEGVAPGGAVQAQAAAPSGAEPTLHFLRVRLGPALPDVWNNHIALDTAARPGDLLAEKTGNRSAVEIGQSVDYRVRVRNVAGTTLTGLDIVDRLPPGFRYVAGSARLDGQPLAEPTLDAGQLLFRATARVLADREEALLSYRAIAGIGTPLGDAVNRASARSGERRSNEAAWKVRVAGGVFADEATLFGKVFVDCRRDGVQDDGEHGVPGVRLLLEDGTGVVTDSEGKYSLYGLRAVTHVLKLDGTTLPAGAVALALDARQSGRGDSRFVDLKKGELQKANFALDGCDVDGVRAEVARRRRLLAERPDAEGEAVARTRIELQATATPSTEQLRSRAARGEIGPGGVKAPEGAAATGGTPSATAPAAAAAARTNATPAAAPPAVAAAPDLEALVRDADAEPGFLGLKDRDALPGEVSHVRVKAALGSVLKLSLDGVAVPEQRVGKRVRLPEAGVEAWEYVGVGFKPGPNRLQLEALDAFGNLRGRVAITVVAPGRLARVLIEAPPSAVAQPGLAVPVVVRLLDEADVAITARTPLTLETTRGRWDTRDLNPDEPGTQVFVEGGRAEFMLVPPSEPLDATLRASAGVVAGERRLAFLPELRPLVGAGILEGVLDLRRQGRVALGQTARDAFEQTLRHLSRESAAGSAQASARAAFYFKGTVRGDLLLTAAYDSDKDTRERLFRDIQPDKFYPIYGDASVKTFDAQSTQRLYLRIDQRQSYLLYGDFSTGAEPGNPSDPRRLSQNARAMTGLKAHHEGETVAAGAYVSHDSLQQAVIEFPADGTSGPYPIPGAGEWLVNSEMVEVLVRDRRQPGLVLSTTTLARFNDYVIEPTTRRILFTAPVASLDENLNTRHIRIRHEVDSGGPAFWSGGADVQAKVNEQLRLGASVQHDGNPVNPATLGGVTAVARLGDRSTLIGELARSSTALAGSDQAARLEWQHEGPALKARAQVTRAGRAFDNPSAGVGKGRTEASAQASAPLGGQTSLRAEAVHSADAPTGARTTGAMLTVGTTLGEGVQGEIGLRASSQIAGQAAAAAVPAIDTSAGLPPVATRDADAFTLRGRLSVRPANLPQAQAYVEAEQDVRESDARMLAVGGEWQVGEKSRLYGRYELISSLGNPYTLNPAQQNNVAVLGLENNLLGGGRLFNEFRLRDAIDGREGQLASGARRSWQIDDGLRLGASLERSSAFGGRAGQRATAATVQLDATADPAFKWHAALEARVADTGNAYLSTLGATLKLDRDWSLLARSAVSLQQQASNDSSTLLSRQQLGLAWRQVDVDRWNGLARYEHQLTRTQGGEQAGEEEAHVLSLHLNHQPRRDLVLSGRAAFKWSRETRAGLGDRDFGQLLFGRATWDLRRDWDASLQAALVRGQGGFTQRLLGLETGWQWRDGLWLSLGWNQRGVSDPLLAGADHLDRGLYLRLRFKFDESLFQ